MLSRAELLKVFVVCAHSETFREAAVKLNMSPQSVSRIIKTLETTFGELLFHRNAKRVKITKFGEILLARADNALSAIDYVFSDSVESDILAGTVTLAAPTEIARDHLYPLLQKLSRDYPDICVSIRASSHFSHLIDEQIDIGLRVGPVRDNRFIVKRVNQMRFHLVAAPSLIDQREPPQSLEELATWPFVDSIDVKTGKSWPWELKDNAFFNPQHITLSTDNIEIERQAVIDGLGVGQLSDWMIQEDVRSGLLIPLLRETEPAPWDVYLYRPQRGPVPRRVRVIFDALSQHFSELNFQI